MEENSRGMSVAKNAKQIILIIQRTNKTAVQQ